MAKLNPQITAYGPLYGISDLGIHRRRPDKTWRLVRQLDQPLLSLVQLTCQRLGDNSNHMLSLLDATSRETPDDPAERWAMEIISQTLSPRQ